MLNTGEKFGAFIVPTGIGAAIGGYAGDASTWARRFSKSASLIVNPNVVNAACFSGITSDMFYIEGYSLDSFFRDEIGLVPSHNNKIGIVFDRAIPKDVLNVHINTINAVKTVYDIEIIGYEVTEKPVGVEFYIDENNISVGSVQNPKTMLEAAQKVLDKGAEAVALVCLFDEAESVNADYANGQGTDPVGGVEAILSHYISKELRVPCAHAPAFLDYQIYPDLVDMRSAAEYITPTFLPCVLLGLHQAPKFAVDGGIRVNELDFVVMPYDAIGSTPVFEALKRKISVYLIKENSTSLNVTPEKLDLDGKIEVFNTYQECLDFIRM